jgi:hypothetical protein
MNGVTRVKTAKPVCPCGKKSKCKDCGRQKRAAKGADEVESASICLSAESDIPKGKRIWFRSDDGKCHVVVLVGKFNKKVEIAAFLDAEATPEQLALLASAEEVTQ